VSVRAAASGSSPRARGRSETPAEVRDDVRGLRHPLVALRVPDPEDRDRPAPARVDERREVLPVLLDVAQLELDAQLGEDAAHAPAVTAAFVVVESEIVGPLHARSYGAGAPSGRGQEERVSKFDFDLFVIGGGSGGVRAARMSAALGAKVALAERARLGGTCVNVGCVPKKLYVYGASVAGALRDAPGLGWTLGEASHDWSRLQRNVAAEVARLNDVYARVVSGAGAELLQGEARVIGPQRVALREGSREREITAEHILLATGAAPRRPALPGAELAWVSDDVFVLEALPKSVVVVGAGYIGLELAGIFAALGVEVTVLARHAHVLPHFDLAVSHAVGKQLEAQGIRVRTGEDVARIERGADRLRVVTQRGHVYEAERALLAVGRDPLVEGLEAIGVTLRGGAVRVDAHHRTNVPGLHAVGDVIGHAQLTPVALAEGTALARTLFGSAPETVDYRTIPTAVFTTPEVATVGLTERAARERGHRLAIFEADFRPMKATITGSAARTLMKLVVDRDSDAVLGVHVVGEDAGEIVQGFAVALVCGAKKRDLDRTIGIHPTAAEELVTMRSATRVDPEEPASTTVR
jgi:glutathione reductase (NADPH)